MALEVEVVAVVAVATAVVGCGSGCSSVAAVAVPDVVVATAALEPNLIATSASSLGPESTLESQLTTKSRHSRKVNLY